MSNIERYFDRLMNEYYRVLTNGWTDSIKTAARQAIGTLVNLNDTQRADVALLKEIEKNIKFTMGEDFASAVDARVKTFCELTYNLASQEPQFKRVLNIRNINLDTDMYDRNNINQIRTQQIFWLKNHYGDAVSEKLQEILDTSIKNNWSKTELAEELRVHFAEATKQSVPYFEGLAEHTSLRIREFGRLNNYKKCGATHYEIVAVMDDRTSDICRALNGKRFPLQKALETMDAMFKVHENKDYETAKEDLKGLAPFVKESDIETIDGVKVINPEVKHTPFPPFHWRCRTRTVMVYE
jgi:SPP1 gp7 family putative phage head morphogenesis protein